MMMPRMVGEAALVPGGLGLDVDLAGSSLLAPALLLGLAVVTNTALVLCLRHTWNTWSQVKLYLVILTAGNLVDTLFALTTQLAINIQQGWQGGDKACKICMFLDVAGTSLANMATAALCLHVLLTSLIGHQGNRARHILLGAIFIVFSLPFPASKIVFTKATVQTEGPGVECSDRQVFLELNLPHFYGVYLVSGALLLVFFPLVVVIGALGGACIANCSAEPKGRANVSVKNNNADLVLAFMLAFMIVLTCAPISVFNLHDLVSSSRQVLDGSAEKTQAKVRLWLVWLYRSRATATALVCLLFGYVHVYRQGRRRHRDKRRQPQRADNRSLVHKLQAADTPFLDD